MTNTTSFEGLLLWLHYCPTYTHWLSLIIYRSLEIKQKCIKSPLTEAFGLSAAATDATLFSYSPTGHSCIPRYWLSAAGAVLIDAACTHPGCDIHCQEHVRASSHNGFKIQTFCLRFGTGIYTDHFTEDTTVNRTHTNANNLLKSFSDRSNVFLLPAVHFYLTNSVKTQLFQYFLVAHIKLYKNTASKHKTLPVSIWRWD
jgi:hypothetical protein